MPVGVFQPLNGFLCFPHHRNWDVGRDPQVAPGLPYLSLAFLVVVHLQFFLHRLAL